LCADDIDKVVNFLRSRHFVEEDAVVCSKWIRMIMGNETDSDERCTKDLVRVIIKACMSTCTDIAWLDSLDSRIQS